MSALEVFERDGWSIRTVTVDGEPWFVAGDICRALGLEQTSRALSRVDDWDKGLTAITTPGGEQEVRTVNESGMYLLVLRSDMPRAVDFRRWLTSEVLPAIRKTGSYSIAPVFEIPTTLAGALRLALEQTERADAAELVAAEQAPKVALVDALMSAEGDYAVRAAAQLLARDHGIQTGEKRLFQTLRLLGWIDKTNQPLQRHLERGVIARKVRTWTDGEGESHVDTQVRITPKGIAELHRRLSGAVTVAS